MEKKIIGLFQECWHSKTQKEEKIERKKLFKTLSKNIFYMARKTLRDLEQLLLDQRTQVHSQHPQAGHNHG